MNISNKSVEIITMIHDKYSEYIDAYCIDINYIKDICNICTTTNGEQSDEFKKKCVYFIEILYATLKLDVEIFNITKNIMTLKNNYELIKSLKRSHKSATLDHIEVLKKIVSTNISDNYEQYSADYISKCKILKQIIDDISKLIELKVFEQTDNLLTLIIPYFYTYIKIIENYR